MLEMRLRRLRSAGRQPGDEGAVELQRAGLFSLEQLKRYGVVLAEQHPLSSHLGPDRLLPRLAENSRRLLVAYDVVTTAASPGQGVVPAEALLLDNFYLIEQQISVSCALSRVVPI